MLQSIGSQGVGHDRGTEQQHNIVVICNYCSVFSKSLVNVLSYFHNVKHIKRGKKNEIWQ